MLSMQPNPDVLYLISLCHGAPSFSKKCLLKANQLTLVYFEQIPHMLSFLWEIAPRQMHCRLYFKLEFFRGSGTSGLEAEGTYLHYRLETRFDHFGTLDSHERDTVPGRFGGLTETISVPRHRDAATLVESFQIIDGDRETLQSNAPAP